MGISRVPVREAIHQLEHEGLVMSTHSRGSFVRYLEEDDIEEIFELRAVLEGLACQMIVQGNKLSADDFELLQQCVDEQKNASGENDYDKWVEAEFQFHTMIMHRAGSRRLFKMWHNLHIQSLFAARAHWDGNLYGSHPIILEALRKESADQFIPLFQELYVRVRDRVLALQSPPADSVPQ
jgi:DNA-binding GntR family transcriptional regulator